MTWWVVDIPGEQWRNAGECQLLERIQTYLYFGGKQVGMRYYRMGICTHRKKQFLHAPMETSVSERFQKNATYTRPCLEIVKSLGFVRFKNRRHTTICCSISSSQFLWLRSRGRHSRGPIHCVRSSFLALEDTDPSQPSSSYHVSVSSSLRKRYTAIFTWVSVGPLSKINNISLGTCHMEWRALSSAIRELGKLVQVWMGVSLIFRKNIFRESENGHIIREWGSLGGGGGRSSVLFQCLQ